MKKHILWNINGINMNKKFLIMIIIAVIAIAAAFTMGLGSNDKMSDSSNLETKQLGDLKFKVPAKYEKWVNDGWKHHRWSKSWRCLSIIGP